MATDVLQVLGGKVRSIRLARGWTLRALAESSGLSVRFLVQLEAGRANISVRRLAELAEACGVTAAALLTETDWLPPPEIVALLGLRGAGKTTIGR
jgi:XRE family transcriptional regulator, aerobic/anaerobic benzoate catabolism transcriptional regulator